MDEKIPVSAVSLEDWQGWRGRETEKAVDWHCYPDETLYPDFKNWIKSLNDRGIKVLGTINTFVSVDPDSIMYREAHKNGYFLKHNDGSDYVSTRNGVSNYTYCQIDLTNQNAYDWLKDLIFKNMVQNGFSGWLADYGEYTPLDAVCESGDIVKYHCELPVLWAKLNRELIEDTGHSNDFYVAHRSAGYGSGKYANSFWTSSKNVVINQYQEIEKAIIGILNAGMSGMLVTHTTCNLPQDTEALSRWCEFCAFSSMFRTTAVFQSQKNEYLGNEEYKIISELAQIHEKLSGYLKITEKKAVNTGLPMMHPLFLQFPDDKQSWNIDSQYMLGDSLMIAPVVKKQNKKMHVWLPAGKWQHIWSKKVYSSTGIFIQISTPLGKPPVFINLNGESATELQDQF